MEYFITVTPENGESPGALFEKIIEFTNAHNAVIIIPGCIWAAEFLVQ